LNATRRKSRSEQLKIVVIQPAVPTYRLGFFGRLAERFGPSFSVYASPGKLGVLTERASHFPWERVLGPMRPLLPGLEWQMGTLSIPIARGDIVVVSGAPRCLSNIALLLKAKWKGARTVWWGHYWSSTSRPWRAGLRMILMRLADAILFYTDREVEEYLNTRKRNRKPIAALNNGIETDEIVRLREPYDPVRRPCDLLLISRLTQKAEIGLLLEALATSTHAGVTLAVIGGGEEERFLRQRAAELGLADRIEWHGGTTDEPRVAAIANRCKLFVYPGSVGLSLIHAFAYGLPAIVHDDRWRQGPEIAALRAGENGAAFKEGDAESLAQTIRTLLDDPPGMKRMSAEAAALTSKTFNAKDMADRFCELIRAWHRD
jgi:glycosyltransferase involved in cell wall biosynthesis